MEAVPIISDAELNSGHYNNIYKSNSCSNFKALHQKQVEKS